jgi:hypothetical protein
MFSASDLSTEERKSICATCCGPQRWSKLAKRTCALSLRYSYSAQHAKSGNELA